MLLTQHRILLENVLEALNRLYDGDSSPRDIHALLVATATAAGGTPLQPPFSHPIEQLAALLNSNASSDPKQKDALLLTDNLRQFVATQIKNDTLENPKRRHHPPPPGH